jgi:hypothetical protein
MVHVVLYAMRFTDRAEPVGPVCHGLKAASSVPSSILTRTVGPQGLQGMIAPAPGGDATFASEVTFTGELGRSASAQASGLITSNFFVDDDLGVVEHHFGVLLVP